jgi:thiol-disulfide isomerase/thioredoxin
MTFLRQAALRLAQVLAPLAARAGRAKRPTMLALTLLVWPTVYAQSPQPSIKFPSTNVAWVSAAVDADVDHVMRRARAENKPVLLYWGATWCPPCNHLKSTLFNRQDFAERSKALIAVHVDGDRPGAQKLGARFAVRGYPTVVLMAANGQELSRLPGEVEADQVMALLQLGLAGGRPFGELLAQARAPVAGAGLPANAWRVLAYHGWEVDETKGVRAAERADVLAELARNAAAQREPVVESVVVERLWLKALALSDSQRGLVPDAALRARVDAVLAAPAAARAHMDILTNQAKALVTALAPQPGAGRQALLVRMDQALQRLQADVSLSRADRVGALTSRIQLAKMGSELDASSILALRQEARTMAQTMDREVTDGYERQAVITAGAHLLSQADLGDDSDALLKGNLARSHSPYYLMSQLASNAKQSGRPAEALRWYRQAFERSVGPATRLQWGAAYLTAQVDGASQDAQAIEATARELLLIASTDPSAFHGRSARSLQRVGDKLKSWHAQGQHTAVMGRLAQQLKAVCAKANADDGQRAACEALHNTLVKA